MNLVKYLSLSAFCATVAGCANYDTDTFQKVAFVSEDLADVTVFVDGEKVGVTPCEGVFSLASSHQITLSKDGYRSEELELPLWENPDTGKVEFVEEIYVPELEEDPDWKPEVASVDVDAVEGEDETPVDETPVDETPVDETPVDETTGDKNVTNDDQNIIVDPAPDPVPQPEDEEESTDKPDSEPEAPKATFTTLKDLQAQLAELKRQRKLNIISAEEFDKLMAELAESAEANYGSVPATEEATVEEEITDGETVVVEE